jgi:hypothetical protein
VFGRLLDVIAPVIKLAAVILYGGKILLIITIFKAIEFLLLTMADTLDKSMDFWAWVGDKIPILKRIWTLFNEAMGDGVGSTGRKEAARAESEKKRLAVEKEAEGAIRGASTRGYRGSDIVNGARVDSGGTIKVFVEKGMTVKASPQFNISQAVGAF